MVNQTYNWSKESLRYTSENLNSNHTDDFSDDFKFLANKSINNVLDIGCGSGEMLHSLTRKILAKKNSLPINGVGLEPSKSAVNKIKKKYTDFKNLKFEAGVCHKLPFKDNSFDLVFAWSVLHWIDRNNYLQSLGEIIRVSRKYVLIMDFFASHNYRVKYKYNKDFFTYKSDFDSILLNSNILKKKKEIIWNINKENKKIKLIKKNFLHFKNNPLNWGSRKTVIYEKKENLLKTYNKNYFLDK